MKIFSNNAVLMCGLILYMGLISCENDNLVSPGTGQNTTRPTDGPTANIPVVMPLGGVSYDKPKHTLSKYGHWQLNYDANGKLIKLQSSKDASYYRQYQYNANGSILIQTFNGGQIYMKTIIVADQQGRCKESYVSVYGFSNGQSTTTIYRYNYYYDNIRNQLKKIENQDKPSQYDQFTYDENGNLWYQETFDGAKKSILTYGYDAPGKPKVLNNNTINVPWYTLLKPIDEFLPVYGALNKHLAVWASFYDMSSNTETDRIDFSYKLTNEGLINERENTRNTAGQTIKETYVFGYQ